MIHSFKVKNFYSIKDEVEVNFVAKNGSITVPELYLDAPFDKKVTKVAFVGGANGSGKTNILRVLAFVKFMMDQTGNTAPGIMPYFPYALDANKSSSISVVFSVDENLYEYEITFDRHMIFSEKLFMTSLVSERATKKKVFSRFWRDDTYVVEVSDLAKNLRSVKEIGAILATKENKTRTLIDLYTSLDEVGGVLREVKDFWSRMFTNVVSFGNLESEFSTSKLANDALKNISENEFSRGLSEKILRSADIGFNGITKFKMAGDENGLTLYGIEHEYNGRRFAFPTLEGSAGTNRIVYLANEIARILSRVEDGVAVIDDMDAFIHPDVYEMLVEQFMSPSINKNGTQLILASHNYTTLNLLDKQQIILTERDEDGATGSWRLDSMKGVESHDNFYAKYMAGKYGAVPRVEV
ncbi:AAA family ATPase [Candidatus Saccharibacteria bacterium]|nr:AAA family ATPase [Candidatus Saccharibacteria bacterium]MBQ3445338.1 AAA family ATPase [Candidatus Saccharibacteria bacterium]